jgi:hypothetical protein
MRPVRLRRGGKDGDAGILGMPHFRILPQPTDTACGPTCLHAVYRAFGDPIDLEQVISEVPVLEEGGTLSSLLACHALRRGYRATLHTYNLRVFDPTWFQRDGIDVAEKLREQAKVKSKRRLQLATRAYLAFLALGGRIRFAEVGGPLIRRSLRRGTPILAGLSATYLYGCARERGTFQLTYDDIEGEAVGHFVVLHAYDPKLRRVLIADPNAENPAFSRHHYAVAMERLVTAIALGVLTYDANLLEIEPPFSRATARGARGPRA